MFARAKAVASKFPLLTSGATISFQFMAGDFIAQTVVEGKTTQTLDRARLASFGTFGAFAGLGPYHLIYNVLYSTTPFIRGGPLAVACFDCGVALPTWYFSSFYTFKEVISSGWTPWEGLSPRQCVTPASDAEQPVQLSEAVGRGLAKWRGDYWNNTMACFSIPFVQNLLMAKYVPGNLKSPFIGVTGLFWVILVSVFRGDA